LYKEKPLIFIPTYNELDNVGRLCSELQALGQDIDILFMDDNSPDGTGKALDELSQQNSNVFVVHRSGKLGVGSAHYDGIQWAYDHNYRRLVTMDCDFTHHPKCINDILTVDADVVVGSRYKLDNSLKGWNLYRKFLTNFGHFLTKTLLHMPFDATGGFRYYRLDRIPRSVFNLVGSKGYSFFFESLYIIHVNRLKIDEIPIALPPRTYGHSKMTTNEIGRSVKLLVSIYMNQLLHPARFLLDGDKSKN
jgi:dolichol-phosphate mannosyltransferase